MEKMANPEMKLVTQLMVLVIKASLKGMKARQRKDGGNSSIRGPDGLSWSLLHALLSERVNHREGIRKRVCLTFCPLLISSQVQKSKAECLA